MRDLVVDGESALLFDPGDEHGCRRALIRAATLQDDALALLGRGAERAAREHCDARDEAHRYLDILNRTGRSACAERFSS
jgi:hypothetical protein